MGKTARFFGNPGSRPAVAQRAPIAHCETGQEAEIGSKFDADQHVKTVSSSDESSIEDLNDIEIANNGNYETSHTFAGLKKGLLDRVLDVVVIWAGSQFMFLLMWVILIVWIVVGIVYSAPFNWQVVMQDGQSIQSYIWDTLLMRQQLMSGHEQILICGRLRSRMTTFTHFLTKNFKTVEAKKEEIETTVLADELNNDELNGILPVESWYDRLSSFVSNILGSVPSMVIFWLGIIVWIICGVIPTDADNDPPFTGRTTGSNPELKKFSSTWQLYINTATAIVILVCTVFLQNIRARHDKFIAKYLIAIFELDDKIDYQLREHIGDFQTPHPVITFPAPKRTRIQKVIDFYADAIGAGIGVGIAIAVFAVWLAIGNTMKWNDDWWLIIGTYTGLVGFLDGFVLREVYFRIVQNEEDNYAKVADDDLALFQQLGIDYSENLTANFANSHKKSIYYRISATINNICSSQWATLASVAIIIGLICIASGMRWSTLGQLLCNTPTMIIEAFFLIVLLQAHNWADFQRRVEVSALFKRRTILLNFVQNITSSMKIESSKD